MAKKEKKSSKIKVVQEPLTYQGNVDLYFKDGDCTIKEMHLHNSATLLLFEGLSKFLAGDFNSGVTSLTANLYQPEFLGIGYQDKPTPTDPLMYRLNNEINVGSRFKINKDNIQIDSEAQSIVLPINTTIPGTSVGGTTFTELGLFSSEAPNTDTLLARITLPEPVEIKVGWSLYIEWNIILQNISRA